jgi:SprT protein
METNTLQKLLNLPPVHVQKAIKQKIRECMDTLENHFGTPLTKPTVVYDLKGHTAGEAYYGENKVRLNLDLLWNEETQREMIDVTLPHEVAHLVAHERHGPLIKSHGWQWAYVMRVLGLPPDRTHLMRTTAARKRKKMPRPFKYHCYCKTHHLTKIVHKRILQGRQYECHDCGGRLTRIN